MKLKSVHPGSCHCQAVEFEVHLPDGLRDPKRCNCSFCRRRGTIVAAASQNEFKILKGSERLTLYEFNTRTAKHYFCSVCGIHTHNVSRTNPDQIRFNIGCLDGVNPFEIQNVPTSDGINHPADRKS